MFDGKFIATLIALVVAVIAICNFNTKKVSSHEGYWGGSNPSVSWKVDREVGNQKGQMYSIPGTYQAILSPRSSSISVGSHVSYNMPDYKNQAVPCEPLTFGSMARENYRENSATENYGCGACGGGCGAVGCRKDGAPKSFHGGAPMMAAGFTSGDYDQVAYGGKGAYPDAVDMVPVGDMTTVNALGETVQPIVYDRFIFANRNSRLRGQGDPIRGDLPIVPCAPEWFRPSVHPNLDLQQGALSVMGGFDNNTGQSMADLIMNTSGDQTIAGINMASVKGLSTSGALSNIEVSAFP